MEPASTSPAPVDARAEQVLTELSHELMSPYCPGRTIASCPSQAARQLEDQILVEAQSGKTREQIEAQLVERFGPEVIGYAGRPIVLWGSVAVAVLAAIALAWLGRRWVQSLGRPVEAATAAAPGAAAPRAEELDALEDALDELDEF